MPPPSQATTAVEGSSYTPIIAGIICGLVVASILTILGWFLWRRRRKQSQQQAGTSARSTYLSKEGKEPRIARQRSYVQPWNNRRRGIARASYYYYVLVLALLHVSLTFLGSNAPPVPTRQVWRTKATEPVEARISLLSRVAVIEATEEEPESLTQTYHASNVRQGEPPQVQALHSLESPTTLPHYPTQQQSHPAYHISQLFQHPAFTPGALLPRSYPPLWKHPAFRPPSTTIPALLDSTPIAPLNKDNTFSITRRTHTAYLPRTSSIPTPPGQVSSCFLESTSDLNIQSQFNKHSVLRYPQEPSPRPLRQYRYTMLPRDVSSQVNGPDTIMPSVLPWCLSESDLLPIPPRPTSPLLPMQANLNECEDHVMSWSSYYAGPLSGIGPASPITLGRSARQREIEQGVSARRQLAARRVELDKQAKEEVEMWSPTNTLTKGNDRIYIQERRGDSDWEVPNTPLSRYIESWAMR